MSRTDAILMVRLPNGMKEVIRKQAEAEHRTITGQVTYLLERAIGNEKAETVAAVPAEVTAA